MRKVVLMVDKGRDFCRQELDVNTGKVVSKDINAGALCKELGVRYLAMEDDCFTTPGGCQ